MHDTEGRDITDDNTTQHTLCDSDRSLTPGMPEATVLFQAADRFESAAKVFLLETLRLAKALRPRARWGYYGFPFCFNNKQTITGTMPCSHEVIPENNRIHWLFEESSALYPSTYLRTDDMSENSNYHYITSRVNEAIRMSKVSPKKNPVYVYIWSKYQDANRFISKEDLYNSVALPRQLGADGVIVWGATKDVNTAHKCSAMLDYLQTHLGPTVKHLQQTSSAQQPNILQIFGK
ncbi:hyaluronidase Tab y 2.0101-like [Macrosteles quadrilineatus]|uniref:hyaluronidase Tab y 2.0101-like n=1 Tax=Macrosteles quadrilineatus TaxID=74068 RepID=UPI0023E09CF3|nr:hyaluronidase Tab y 2.0101-like [Macrosteles quadrilineatus]